LISGNLNKLKALQFWNTAKKCREHSKGLLLNSDYRDACIHRAKKLEYLARKLYPEIETDILELKQGKKSRIIKQYEHKKNRSFVSKILKFLKIN